MDYFKLLVDTVKELEPSMVKLPEAEYQTHKREILKDAADTGRIHVYNFIIEVFEIMDGKRAKGGTFNE